MNRLMAIGVVLSLAVGGIVVVRFSGGCGTPRTRIAQKTLYEGPATMPASARSWPRWRGQLGDGISRETGLLDAWPEGGPTALWSAEVGLGYASPVAADGRVYLFTMSDDVETLTCFDANSGRILWSEGGGEGRTASYPGTRATPTLDGEDIITFGGAGELTCREAASGAKRWSLNILEETGASALDWGTASTPLVTNDSIYVQVGQGGPVALAVDRKSGDLTWRSEAMGISGYASPILAEVGGTPQLIVFAGKAIYGMNPATGATLWQHEWKTSYDVNASTPIYRDGRVFLTSAYGSGAVMLRLEKSDKPTVEWQNQQIQSRFQPAILDGDILYVNSEGLFIAVNPADGAIVWRDDNVLKLGVGGSFLRVGDDRLISLAERGRVSLAQVSRKGIQLISSFKSVDGSQSWAMPLIYGGRLYVKGEQEFICYDIKAPQPTSQPVSLR